MPLLTNLTSQFNLVYQINCKCLAKLLWDGGWTEIMYQGSEGITEIIGRPGRDDRLIKENISEF